MPCGTKLDDVFPGLREQYTKKRVEIDDDLLEEWRADWDDWMIKVTVGDILKEEFQESGNSSVMLEFEKDGQKQRVTVFIENELDEDGSEFYLIKMGQKRPA
jgi:hypothetical protein